jgi:hypothetical protein
MEHHVGIDVSLELSSLCVLDAAGKVIREAKVGSGEHQDLWGAQAAVRFSIVALSLARPGYQRSNSGRRLPSSERVRVCNSRCAPRRVHCIC